ncbi:3-oxoacyl-[acyl-carrier-protein] reductase FabG [Fundidesulfovibrio magnetotacticus]|uniref:3-oxoacyl-[acyl-carrier-protein] reductase FabG n=1 Tax=Fundidesulfovibrio magnetotacticus TaxID=2730080 RepID=A0A6V8LVM6_9BACT|nr:SDR family oxidoreductase [Fundidesulfovibrio magnetotacticus]GFK94990.1 3-oxoacyl-[acyl-carrier-protein] reductase FabG [Fundidesulfovibrio magnetotacticus]
MSRLAVVTGGNKGIGLATTRRLLEAGCEVAVVARDFTGFPLAGEARVRAVPFDLSRVEDIPALVAEIGEIDILVNNAGIMHALPWDAYPREKMETLLRVNLEAPLALMREAGRGMAERGAGRIVNNASLAAHTGHPDVWYGISKAGLKNATKSFARLLGPRGVVVNAVAPGPAETDMLDTIPEPRRKAVLEAVYTGRFCRADEVAAAIAWLALESPEYINGVCIDLNNGSFPR